MTTRFKDLLLLLLIFSITSGYFIYSKGINLETFEDANIYKSKNVSIRPNVINDLVKPDEQKDKLQPTSIPTVKPILTPTAIAKTEPEPKFCIRMPVLMYHHIQPEDRAKQYGQESLTVYPNVFEEQIKYLKDKGYNAMDAKDLINAVNEQKTLPGKNIVITLDDGYSDSNEFALKIAAKYGMKINVFVVSNLVNKGGYLTWNSIIEMKKKSDNKKYIKFYNHTVSHHDLRSMSYKRVSDEINIAQQEIEKHIGETPKILAYPYGFYNENVIQALKDNEFKGAFSTEPGNRHCDTNLYHLPRIRMGNGSAKAYGL